MDAGPRSGPAGERSGPDRAGSGPDGARPDAVDARLSFVAHEVLNPLAIAQGYARLLEAEAAGVDETLRGLAERVARNVEVAVLLLGSLRDAGGCPEELRLERQRLDLVALVRDTVEDLASTVAADHPVELHVPDEAVDVVGDPTRLRQVVFNLVSNGARYSGAGAPIHVAVTVDDTVTLEVRDHGRGVAPGDVERLFRCGTRGVADARQGLGIGLYVSRLIAEAHDGSLTLEPAGDEGARCLLRLPIGAR
jgi:signal transduction histidine kinase